MRIIMMGPKASGKSTAGKALAERLGIPFIDLDDRIIAAVKEDGLHASTCAEIYRMLGPDEFRTRERKAVAALDQYGYLVLATGGSTLLEPESRRLLRERSIWVYLSASAEYLWDRIREKTVPAYLAGADNPQERFTSRVDLIDEVLRCRCDIRINIEHKSVTDVVNDTVVILSRELSIRSSSPNTLGEVVRLTTFGESHGPMIGAVLDGVRPGLPLSPEDIQHDLDRRRPGQSGVTTARKEGDRVDIVSGVFLGKTTGTPITFLIRNADSHSSHYESIKDLFRPGHADYTFWQKYGLRDYRGGGRSSGRETAARVAGGAAARKMLHDRGVRIVAYTAQIADVRGETFDYNVIEQNPVRCPDPCAAKSMEERIRQAQTDGDSVGGVIQLEVDGLPAGLGDPVFAKLDAKIAAALFSVGAVKGVEIGEGFRCADLRGSDNNDSMSEGRFLSNHAGGVLGGISTGQTLVARVAVKPTPSVTSEQKTIDIHGEDRTVSVGGRHDPCIVPRAVPVIEAMVALVLLDMWEIQEQIRPGWSFSQKNSQGERPA